MFRYESEAKAGLDRINVALFSDTQKANRHANVLMPVLMNIGNVLYDVDFAYEPGKTVPPNLSLYARPGQKVAFVGSAGAGKTTITNLLNRFYDIADGKIRYDDINYQ